VCLFKDDGKQDIEKETNSKILERNPGLKESKTHQLDIERKISLREMKRRRTSRDSRDKEDRMRGTKVHCMILVQNEKKRNSTTL
jgi:hypothetical protein